MPSTPKKEKNKWASELQVNSLRSSLSRLHMLEEVIGRGGNWGGEEGTTSQSRLLEKNKAKEAEASGISWDRRVRRRLKVIDVFKVFTAEYL